MTSDKLQTKLAENRARTMQPALRKTFARKLGCGPQDIVFADLMTTRRTAERLHQRWASERKASTGTSIVTEDRAEVIRLVEEIRTQFSQRTLYLMHDGAGDAGAILLRGDTALEHLDDILEFEGEDLILSDEGACCAIAIEWFMDRTPERQCAIYRVAAWHDE